jgi:hypothetical protein
MKHNDVLLVTFFTKTTKQLEKSPLHIIESRKLFPPYRVNLVEYIVYLWFYFHYCK